MLTGQKLYLCRVAFSESEAHIFGKRPLTGLIVTCAECERTENEERSHIESPEGIITDFIKKVGVVPRQVLVIRQVLEAYN